jgi:HprK-related kinase A
LLEWGLNWCIATQAHQFLMLHSAVVEKNGDSLILPALPGAGKSTLCAALSHRGWRLLSDEFGLIEPETKRVLPLPRAVPLKNRSIEVIRRFAPEAHLGPVFENTRKGTVAHMRPPGDSLARQREPARPRWILFPRFQANADLTIRPIEKAVAFIRLSQNSFNYRLLGALGFRTLAPLIRTCNCYSLRFGDLDEVVAALDREFFR